VLTPSLLTPSSPLGLRSILKGDGLPLQLQSTYFPPSHFSQHRRQLCLYYKQMSFRPTRTSNPTSKLIDANNIEAPLTSAHHQSIAAVTSKPTPHALPPPSSTSLPHNAASSGPSTSQTPLLALESRTLSGVAGYDTTLSSNTQPLSNEPDPGLPPTPSITTCPSTGELDTDHDASQSPSISSWKKRPLSSEVDADHEALADDESAGDRSAQRPKQTKKRKRGWKDSTGKCFHLFLLHQLMNSLKWRMTNQG